MTTLAERWQQVRTQARLYATTVRWYFGRLIRHNPYLFAAILLLDLGGRTVQGVAFIVIILYVQAIEQGGAVETFLGAIDPLNVDVFTITIGGITVLLAAAAVLLFSADRLRQSYCTAFGERCVSAVLAQTRARPGTYGWHSSLDAPKETVALASALIRYVRSSKALLSTAAPFVVVVAVLAALAYLSPAALGLLVVLVLPSSLFHYRINLRAVRNEKILLAASKKRRRFLNRLTQSLATDMRSTEEASTLVHRALQKPQAREHPAAYGDRVLAQARANLVSNVAIAVTVGALVAFLGGRALLGEISWTHFLAVLVATRLLLLSMRTLPAAIAGFARHFPAIHRLYRYIVSASEPRFLSRPSVRLAATADSRRDAAEPPRVSQGSLVGVVSPVRISRYSLSDFARVLGATRARLGRHLGASDFAVMSDRIEAPVSAADLFGTERGERYEDLRAAFQAHKARLPRLIKSLVERDEVGERRWRTLQREHRALAILFGLYAREAPIVFVDADCLDALTPDMQAPVLSLLARRCTFVCYIAGDAAPCRFGEAFAVLIGGEDDELRVIDVAELSADPGLARRREEGRTSMAEDDYDVHDDEL